MTDGERNWTGILNLSPVEGLDHGIAPWVEMLRAWRVETFESCQGGDGHAYPEPTIAFHGGPAAGFHAYSVAVTHALPVKTLRRVWKHSDHELVGPCWEMVFRRPATAEEATQIEGVLAFERGDR